MTSLGAEYNAAATGCAENKMAELFRMWSNTRMVVLTAICAALYAAILIPFKVVPLIPGITEFRPANAVHPVGRIFPPEPVS